MNIDRRDRGFGSSLVIVAVGVLVAYGLTQLNAGRRTRENIRLCAAKYQEAHNSADTAVVDNYQVAPPEPKRNETIPAIICRKYRGVN